MLKKELDKSFTTPQIIDVMIILKAALFSYRVFARDYPNVEVIYRSDHGIS